MLAAGAVTFNFNALTAGTYYAWVRAKLADEDQNEFFVTAGGQTFQAPAETEVTGDGWDWRQLLLNDDDELEPQPLTLAAGANEVILQEREGGAKFGYLLLTNREDPNLEIFNEQFYDVEIDISDLAGTPAKIIATVWEKAQGEDQTKAIGVKELRIDSEKKLRIKGIYPQINGFFDSSHATYTYVEGTFGGATR